MASNHLEQALVAWRKSRQAPREKFLEAMHGSEQDRERWRKEWERHDAVVWDLAKSFTLSKEKTESVLDESQMMVQKEIAFRGGVVPETEEAVKAWAIGLWERLHYYRSIRIDLPRCLQEAKRLWG
jgi:hypothetical protein